MAILRVQDFSGTVPVVGDRALPDNFATESVNTWLYGSELRGIRPPEEVIAINPTTKKVFRIPKRTVGGDPSQPTEVPPPSYLGDSVWVQFTDPDTDIVRGQLLEDSFERYYFCSPTTGPMFNTYARLQSGLPGYKLGVQGPDTTTDVDGNNAARPIISSVAPITTSSELYEIEFKIADTVGGATSYTNPGGSGNRTGSITITGTAAFSAAASGLVDGNKTGPAGLKITNLDVANKTIQFDFGSGATKKINEITFYQKDSDTYGTWEFQGSNDASAWTKLGSGVLGGGVKATYTINNTAVYRYYRLFQAAASDPIMLTRAYLYTWVNEFGEESAPSLPVVGAGPSLGTWTITNITDPAPVAGYAAYTKKRLYRTITGSSGQTTFYRVAEIPLGTTSYVDDTSVLTDAVLANNLVLESTTWAMPPSDLEGFIAMPNGFLIGFKGSDIYMSESYHFHAWPADYKQATEAPVVGLGILGQTCVVCTQGYPATVTGVKPATVSFTKSTTNEPCLSRGSIVSMPDGVLYASQNGLVLVGPAGISNVTEKLITRDEWLRLFSPAHLRSVRYQNGYMATIMETGDPTTAFYIDPSALKVALTELSDFTNIQGVVSDFWSGEVLLIRRVGSSADVLRWDAPSDEIMPFRWKSKEFQYPFKENFACYAIYWDQARFSDQTEWGNAVLPADEVVRFRVYADRVLKYDQEVPLQGHAIRLPSGFKADVWQFEIIGRAPVYSMHVASTIKELKSA